nr:hypothetical protein [uncultured Mediterraneibacter sp.]
MELKDTIELMTSSDYKERLKAEYLQTRIRYNGLNKMLVKLEAGTLEFTPTCSKALLMEQRRYMSEYLRTLEIRMEIEGISLES